MALVDKQIQKEIDDILQDLDQRLLEMKANNRSGKGRELETDLSQSKQLRARFVSLLPPVLGQAFGQWYDALSRLDTGLAEIDRLLNHRKSRGRVKPPRGKTAKGV